MAKNLFSRLYIDSFRGLPKEVWLLSFTMLINRSGMMVITFLSLYLTQELQWSKSEAGIVLSCFGGGSLAGSFLGGWLSDKIGNFKVMFYSLIVGGAMVMLLGVITNFYLLCIAVFAVVTVVDAVRPALFAEVGDRSNESNLTRGISLVRMAVNLGIAIGPAVGGLIAHTYGYFWLFIIDGSTCILAGFFLFFSLKSGPTNVKKIVAQEPSHSPYKDGQFLIFCFFNLLILTSFFQILFSVPVYMKEVFSATEAQVGWFFTANGLIIFLCEMPIIYFIEKTKATFKPLMIGAVMIGVSYICLFVFHDPLMAIGSFLFFSSFGEIINFPYISTIAIKRADELSRGNYMGATTVLFSLAFLIAPLVGLPIIDIVGYQSYWLMAFAAAVIGAVGCKWSQNKIEPYFHNLETNNT